MDPAQFRRHGHALVEWIAEYLAGSGRYPVLSRGAPGDVRRALPAEAPERGESFEAIVIVREISAPTEGVHGIATNELLLTGVFQVLPTRHPGDGGLGNIVGTARLA